MLTSQLPVAKWHSQIGDSTLAEGILDRIIHRAHRIELRGDDIGFGNTTAFHRAFRQWTGSTPKTYRAMT